MRCSDLEIQETVTQDRPDEKRFIARVLTGVETVAECRSRHEKAARAQARAARMSRLAGVLAAGDKSDHLPGGARGGDVLALSARERQLLSSAVPRNQDLREEVAVPVPMEL